MSKSNKDGATMQIVKTAAALRANKNKPHAYWPRVAHEEDCYLCGRPKGALIHWRRRNAPQR